LSPPAISTRPSCNSAAVAFARGEVITCVNTAGREVARGLTNYSSAEAKLIQRHASAEIETILGYMLEPELIHRDNLVLV